MNWYVAVLRNYAGFEGRARRAEFWWFALVNFAINCVLRVLGLFPFLGILFLVAGFVYALAVLLPSIAVTIRRLHDTDRSGWWTLLWLVPMVGWIILIIFCATEGTRGPNTYGADPKEAPEPTL